MVGAGASDEARTKSHTETSGRASSSGAPTMAQWQLGVRLRSLRERRGLLADDVAERLLWPLTRLRELESGARRPTADDLAELGALFKVDETTAEDLTALAEGAQEPGWWSRYEDLRVPYIGLEEHASRITAYTAYYFPALVQTADYSRAIIRGVAPKMKAEILRQRVEARLRRQQVIGRNGALEYRVLLDESALGRPIGGPAVMCEQLDKILSLIQDGKISAQIIPLAIGVNVAQDSNFVLLDFATQDVFSVVYVEGLAEAHYLDRIEHIERYREAIDYLYKSALNQQDSMQLIVQVRDAYAAASIS
jgi:transcriptional regulator with XRE-family HTH domain